ncbi:hypothetical protein BDAP_000423 [Binucleata daphniae]
MKKIDITDLIGNSKAENNKKLHKSIDLPEIKQEKQKTSIYDNFYEITPENELEMCIQKVMTKKDYKQKTRQNIILAQFDSKMRRINKIKSKAYRRIRRKEKVVENLVDEGGSGVLMNPDEMIKKHENNNNDEQTYNEDIDAMRNKSQLLNKLLKKNNSETKTENNSNVMSFSAEKKENYEKQKEIVKSMFKECNNEFEDEFNEQKKDIVENEMPSIEKEVLPGWNCWGGADIEVVETKYNTFIRRKDGIKIEDRKDYKQSHVIINENNKTLDEKYIPVLPYGFTKEDYKMKMDMPVSKEWNTLRMFNKLVRDESKNKKKEVFEYESKYL